MFKKIYIALFLILFPLLGLAKERCPLPVRSNSGLVKTSSGYKIHNCSRFKRFLVREYNSGCKVTNRERKILCRHRSAIVSCDPLIGMVLDYRYCN